MKENLVLEQGAENILPTCVTLNGSKGETLCLSYLGFSFCHIGWCWEWCSLKTKP